MSKKFTIITVLIVLAASFTGSLLHKQNTKIGKIDYTNKMIVKKEDGSVTNIPVYGSGFVNYAPPVSGVVPGLDNYMDYATNGNSLQGILVSAGYDTIIVAATYCDSLDAPNANGGTTMRSRYNYSVNGGTTWELTTGLDFSLGRKTRYPDLYPLLLSGSFTVGSSGRVFDPPASGTTRRGGVAEDVVLGAGSPTVYAFPWTGVTPNSDAFVHKRPDGKVGVVISPNNTDSITYTTWDPATQTHTGRSHVWAPNPTLGNTVSSYIIGASMSGNHMTIASVYINEPGNLGDNYRSVRIFTSTNNGSSWSAPVKYGFNSSSPNVLGGDSCQVYWHEDIAYKPGTTTPYVVFSTYPYVWDGSGTVIAVEENKGWKIMIQSPAINGGTLPVTIADWHNIEILGNTTLYNQIVDFQVNSALLSHPSVGFSGDGNTIWVAYSVIQKDSCVGYTATFNYFDVYTQKSTDGGLTWSTPVNVTNTPTNDEMYPMVAEVNNLSSEPFLVHHSDRIPGCHAFTDGQTVGKVQYVFHGGVIGIKGISSEVPEKYSLSQNYPNPFNPSTKIRFAVPKASNVSIEVFDINGRLVSVLANNEYVTAGIKEVEFNAANLASGVYFYKLSVSDFTATRKMILVK